MGMAVVNVSNKSRFLVCRPDLSSFHPPAIKVHFGTRQEGKLNNMSAGSEREDTPEAGLK